MTLTDRELRTVYAVFESLEQRFSDEEMHCFIGSITMEEMKTLRNKLYYRDYCEEHGVAYEDLTDDDFIRAYEERMCW